MFIREEGTKDLFISPLNLLYSAWADQQPPVNQRVTEQYITLDTLLFPLSEQVRHQVYQTICQVITDHERQAFLDGLRTGACLAAELAE